MPAKPTGAFPLVELPAAVAIIGTLAVPVAAARQSMSESANASKCVSNMRQTGVALHPYASEQDDPPVVINSANGKYRGMDAIWKYAMNGVKPSSTPNDFTNYKDFIFYCPGTDPNIHCSYAIHVMFPDGVRNLDHPRKRGAISRPADCLLPGEGRNHAINSWFYASVGQPVQFPHRNRQTLLFVDLHAESRTADQNPERRPGSPRDHRPFPDRKLEPPNDLTPIPMDSRDLPPAIQCYLCCR